MRRIRIALLALSLAVLVPLLLLAWRALAGVAVERAVRHQAVAERVFDEMERALSEFLAREEARPFEAYRFYVSGPGDRSPLARPDALEPFVIGAFQIDPDGSLHTPMQPRDPGEAVTRGDWPPPREVEVAIARVRAAAAAAWRAGGDSPRLSKSDDALPGPDARAVPSQEAGRPAPAAAVAEPSRAQAPGTTRPVDGAVAEVLEEREQAGASDELRSAYDVLERLNRGAEARADRRQKVAQAVVEGSGPARLPPSGERDAPPAAAPPPSAATPREAGEPLRDLPLPQLRGLGSLVSEPLASEASAEVPPAEPSAARVALDPMVGRSGADGTLLLTRTVVVGARAYRQGLLLDRRALGRWLEVRAFGEAGVGRLGRLRFDGNLPPGEGFGFQHRFAEPFDALEASLRLAPLPGVGSPGAVYAVLGIGGAVALLGLFAVQRMVAVAVEFAERRNSFVASVTHELRTPLTAIRMYGEMLRDGLVAGDAKRQQYYGTITDEAERLSHLVDNVLEFSRLEHGRRELQLRAGAVGPVLEDAAQRLATHAEREGVRLEVHVAPGLPAVRFDRDALLQVLYNLVDNAMKYGSRAGERRVVLEASHEGEGVLVSVRDFGPGVAPRHLARIFEPFYRAEAELTREARGTGIGLALVKDLAERMGAAVRSANPEEGGFRVGLAFQAAAER